MRLRIYVDGRPGWSENQPSYARVPSHGGSLVVGSGWRENRLRRKDQENAARRASRAAKKDSA